MTLTKVKLNEVFKPSKLFEVETESKLTEEEKQMIADGILLCVFEGESFVPNGESRNKRFYSEEFWNHVLSKDSFKRKLELGQMFGQIGHREDPVSDIDLNNGDYSHKVVKAWISEDKKGMCRYWVYNTESGKSLQRLIKSKTILFVSTRADGDYEEDVTFKGMPVVNKFSYDLSGWDFVQEPGFLQAKPNMLENKNNSNEEGGNQMTLEEQLKKLTESVSKMQENFENKEKSTPINESAEIVKLKEDFNSMKTKFSVFESLDKSVFESLKNMTAQEITSLVNKNINLSGEARIVNHVHEGFNYDGVFIPTKSDNIPLDKIHNSLGKELNENYPIQVLKVSKNESYYNSNGILMLWQNGKRPEKILESVSDYIQNNAGSLFEGYGVNAMANAELLRKYKSFATPEKIEENLKNTLQMQKVFEAYSKLGTPEEIEKSLNLLDSICEKLEPIGTINSIRTNLYKGFKIAESYRKESAKSKRSKFESKVKEISEKFEMDIKTVSKMLKSLGEAEAIKTIKNLKNINESNGDNKKPEGKKPTNEGFYKQNRSVRQSIVEGYLVNNNKGGN